MGFKKSQRFYEMSAPAAQTSALGRRASIDLAIALAILFVSAVALGRVLTLSGAFTLKALTVFLAGAALMWPLLAQHAPHDRFGPANRTTLARAIMVALLAALLGEGHDPTIAAVALSIAVPALATDALDGWLARRAGMTSAFGARFDMEADALFVMVLCLLVWQLDKAGPWVLAAGLARYAFVAAAWPLPWLRRPLRPSTRRKVACVLQIVALLVALAPFVAVPTSTIVAAVSVVVLLCSFAIDVAWLARERRYPQRQGS